MNQLIRQLARSVLPVSMRERMHIFAARLRYVGHLRKIRRKISKGERLNVLFLVSETAKWKCQTVYDAFKADGHYNPVVGAMIQDAERSEGASELDIAAGIDRAVHFYRDLGCTIESIHDPKTRKVNWDKIKAADIVFYQQPWNVGDIFPRLVARYALTAYVSYYVPNYQNDALSYNLMFHHFIAYNFVLNDEELRHAKSASSHLPLAGKLVVAGHPALDNYFLNPPGKPIQPCVIYAPHFTFSHPNNPVIVHYSTFLKTGEWILSYAKAHAEIKWVFKPHPVLKSALIRSQAWDELKIRTYYGEWGKIGRVCENGDYEQLFREATALITDCGSFLTEFAVTGQPIINLVNPENTSKAPSLYDSYYKVCNIHELDNVLHEVLGKGNDFKKDERLAAVRNANLAGQNAAKNILGFYAKEFRINQ